MKRRLGIGLTAGLALTALVSVSTSPGVVHAAQPKPGHAGVVPVTPRTNTPKIAAGEIWDFETVGNKVYVAGSFTSIRNAASGSPAIAQKYLMAYDVTTGLVDQTFKPTFDNQVMEVEASPDGTKLFVVGQFNTINGVAKRKIASINPSTGAPIAGFTANANGRATSLAVSNTAVYVGGQFTAIGATSRGALAQLNPTTGAVDAGFNVPLTGGLGLAGLLTVQRLKLTHDETKLMVVHTARQMAGLDRYGVGFIDTATKAVTPWQTRLWQDNLAYVGGIVQAYAGDISPDDSYFVVTSGSGGDRPPINDTAMAFSTTGGADMQPLWITRNFDSTYSVAISEQAVYIGGHFSATESPTSSDPWPGLATTGYGTGQGPGGLGSYVLGDEVVRRSMLAALDPVTGKALEWNPGGNAYEGFKALEVTPRGLLFGGDGTIVGGQNTGRIGIFDFASNVAQNAADTNIVFPYDGQVVPANAPMTLTGTATTTSGRVKSVVLEIVQKGTKRYLQKDLVTWSTTYATINAVLATANATSTNWSLTFSVPTAEVQVYARTTSTTAIKDNSKAYSQFEARSLDDATPVTAIVQPAGELLSTLVPSLTFTASGTAIDDHGILGVTYSLRNMDTLQFLQEDGSVGTAYHSFRIDPDVVGAPNGTWHTEVTVPSEGRWRMNVSSTDTAGQTDVQNVERTFVVTLNGVAPSVTLTAPVAINPPTPAAPFFSPAGQAVTLAGTASDDSAITAVAIVLVNTTTGDGLAGDGTFGGAAVTSYYKVTPFNTNTQTTNWSYTTPALPSGIYYFQAFALDDAGLLTPLANWIRTPFFVQIPGDAFPETTLGFAGVEQNFEALHLDITGTATDDKGVANVRVLVQDVDTANYVTAAGTFTPTKTWIDVAPAAPNALSTTFALPLNLPGQGHYKVTAVAIDTVGQWDGSAAGAAAEYLIYPGDTDPTLVSALDSPVNGATLPGNVVVGGRAQDDHGIKRVQVTIRNSGGLYMSSTGVFGAAPVWVETFLTSPGTPGSNFSYTSPTLPNGTYTVNVRAVDIWGQVQQTPRVFTVNVN